MADLELGDALKDAPPEIEPEIKKDFISSLEAEPYDDVIGETCDKTDYVPLLDDDETEPKTPAAVVANGEHGEIGVSDSMSEACLLDFSDPSDFFSPLQSNPRIQAEASQGAFDEGWLTDSYSKSGDMETQSGDTSEKTTATFGETPSDDSANLPFQVTHSDHISDIWQPTTEEQLALSSHNPSEAVDLHSLQSEDFRFDSSGTDSQVVTESQLLPGLADQLKESETGTFEYEVADEAPEYLSVDAQNFEAEKDLFLDHNEPQESPSKEVRTQEVSSSSTEDSPPSSECLVSEEAAPEVVQELEQDPVPPAFPACQEATPATHEEILAFNEADPALSAADWIQESSSESPASPASPVVEEEPPGSPVIQAALELPISAAPSAEEPPASPAAEAEIEASPATQDKLEPPAAHAEIEHPVSPAAKIEVEPPASEECPSFTADQPVQFQVEPPASPVAETQVEPPASPVAQTQVEPPASPVAQTQLEPPASPVAQTQLEPPASPEAQTQVEPPASPVAQTQVEPPVAQTQLEPPASPVAQTQVEPSVSPVAQTQVEPPVAQTQLEPPASPVAQTQVEPPVSPLAQTHVEPPASPVAPIQLEPPASPVAQTQVEPPVSLVAQAELEPPASPVAQTQVEPPASPVAQAQVEPPASPVAQAQVEPPASLQAEIPTSSKPEGSAEGTTLLTEPIPAETSPKTLQQAEEASVAKEKDEPQQPEHPTETAPVKHSSKTRAQGPGKGKPTLDDLAEPGFTGKNTNLPPEEQAHSLASRAKALHKKARDIMESRQEAARDAGDPEGVQTSMRRKKKKPKQRKGFSAKESEFGDEELPKISHEPLPLDTSQLVSFIDPVSVKEFVPCSPLDLKERPKSDLLPLVSPVIEDLKDNVPSLYSPEAVNPPPQNLGYPLFSPQTSPGDQYDSRLFREHRKPETSVEAIFGLADAEVSKCPYFSPEFTGSNPSAREKANGGERKAGYHYKEEPLLLEGDYWAADKQAFPILEVDRPFVTSGMKWDKPKKKDKRAGERAYTGNPADGKPWQTEYGFFDSKPRHKNIPVDIPLDEEVPLRKEKSNVPGEERAFTKAKGSNHRAKHKHDLSSKTVDPPLASCQHSEVGVDSNILGSEVKVDQPDKVLPLVGNVLDVADISLVDTIKIEEVRVPNLDLGAVEQALPVVLGDTQASLDVKQPDLAVSLGTAETNASPSTTENKCKAAEPLEVLDVSLQTANIESPTIPQGQPARKGQVDANVPHDRQSKGKKGKVKAKANIEAILGADDKGVKDPNLGAGPTEPNPKPKEPNKKSERGSLKRHHSLENKESPVLPDTVDNGVLTSADVALVSDLVTTPELPSFDLTPKTEEPLAPLVGEVPPAVLDFQKDSKSCDFDLFDQLTSDILTLTSDVPVEIVKPKPDTSEAPNLGLEARLGKAGKDFSKADKASVVTRLNESERDPVSPLSPKESIKIEGPSCEGAKDDKGAWVPSESLDLEVAALTSGIDKTGTSPLSPKESIKSEMPTCKGAKDDQVVRVPPGSLDLEVAALTSGNDKAGTSIKESIKIETPTCKGAKDDKGPQAPSESLDLEVATLTSGMKKAGMSQLSPKESIKSEVPTCEGAKEDKGPQGPSGPLDQEVAPLTSGMDKAGKSPLSPKQSIKIEMPTCKGAKGDKGPRGPSGSLDLEVVTLTSGIDKAGTSPLSPKELKKIETPTCKGAKDDKGPQASSGSLDLEVAALTSGMKNAGMSQLSPKESIKIEMPTCKGAKEDKGPWGPSGPLDLEVAALTSGMKNAGMSQLSPKELIKIETPTCKGAKGDKGPRGPSGSLDLEVVTLTSGIDKAGTSPLSPKELLKIEMPTCEGVKDDQVAWVPSEPLDLEVAVLTSGLKKSGRSRLSAKESIKIEAPAFEGAKEDKGHQGPSGSLDLEVAALTSGIDKADKSQLSPKKSIKSEVPTCEGAKEDKGPKGPSGSLDLEVAALTSGLDKAGTLTRVDLAPRSADLDEVLILKSAKDDPKLLICPEPLSFAEELSKLDLKTSEVPIDDKAHKTASKSLRKMKGRSQEITGAKKELESLQYDGQHGEADHLVKASPGLLEGENVPGEVSQPLLLPGADTEKMTERATSDHEDHKPPQNIASVCIEEPKLVVSNTEQAENKQIAPCKTELQGGKTESSQVKAPQVPLAASGEGSIPVAPAPKPLNEAADASKTKLKAKVPAPKKDLSSEKVPPKGAKTEEKPKASEAIKGYMRPTKARGVTPSRASSTEVKSKPSKDTRHLQRADKGVSSRAWLHHYPGMASGFSCQ